MEVCSTGRERASLGVAGKPFLFSMAASGGKIEAGQVQGPSDTYMTGMCCKDVQQLLLTNLFNLVMNRLHTLFDDRIK